MRGRFHKWAPDYLKDHPEAVIQQLDPKDEFFQADHLYLEIGMGKGDFILGISEKFEGHFLGIERDVSIIGLAAKKLVASEKENVMVIPGDFDILLEKLSELRFDKIFLNFPDPWPKKRHEKRRLLTKGRLSQMLSLLKEDGELRFKTDNDGLYAFALEQIEEAKFNMVYNVEDYQLADDDVMSEYERNFRSKGQPIHRIILHKGGK